MLTLDYGCAARSKRFGVASSACIVRQRASRILIENRLERPSESRHTVASTMTSLIRTRPNSTRVVALDPHKRVRFLTKDTERHPAAEAARRLDLSMSEVDPQGAARRHQHQRNDPAWVCFRHKPEDIALDAYAGLLDEQGERVFGHAGALDGAASR